MLGNFIGDRNSGLLFQSRNGKPLHQSTVLRRKLHPVLAKLGQPKCGLHPFRRFRNTYLRNFTATPPGLLQFWMGHAGEGMSDLYDKIKADVKCRKEMAEEAGLGFELPKDFSSKTRYWTETDGKAKLASVCMCLKQRNKWSALAHDFRTLQYQL